MIELLDLSNEILLQISNELGHERNISAFSRTNRRLYLLLCRFIIQYNVWKSESSALLWAGKHGDENLARKVLAEGGTAQVPADCQWPWSPLTLAVANKHEHLFHLFLGSCEDLDINWSSTEHRRTALSLAAEQGSLPIVETLLATGRADPNEEYGEPLALSCENGHQTIVELLLRQRDIDLRPFVYPDLTPLSHAASKGHLEIAKLLLEVANVDPNDEGEFDRTPFLWAAWMGYTKVMELLLTRNEVVPDKAYDMNRTPLSFAAGSGRLDAVKLLLTKTRAKSDTVDIHGRTPLHWAINWDFDNNDDDNHDGLFQGLSTQPKQCMSGQERTLRDIINLLLAHGANPDSKDDNKRTPITLAIERGRQDIVKLLLGTGKIDLTHKDDEGRTPLMWAKMMKDEESAKLLLCREC